MKNDKNDVVIIELDRPRELRFRHRDMKKLEAMTDKTLNEIDSSIGSLETEHIETMILCGLSKDAEENGETLSKEKVSELLDHAPYFLYPLEKIVEAWRVAFGLPSRMPEGNETPEGKPIQ